MVTSEMSLQHGYVNVHDYYHILIFFSSITRAYQRACGYTIDHFTPAWEEEEETGQTDD